MPSARRALQHRKRRWRVRDDSRVREDVFLGSELGGCEQRLGEPDRAGRLWCRLRPGGHDACRRRCAGRTERTTSRGLQAARAILAASSEPSRFLVFASDGLRSGGLAAFNAAVATLTGTGTVATRSRSVTPRPARAARTARSTRSRRTAASASSSRIRTTCRISSRT